MMSWLWIPIAGLWSMDRNTAFNTMLSRPLAVSAVVGALAGNFYWCVAAGTFFEIIGLMDLPVGTRISRDDTFGAFAASACMAVTPVPGFQYLLLAIILAYILMYPVTWSTVFTRWLNKRLLYRLKSGREGTLIFIGQLVSFMRGALIYTAATLFTLWIYRSIYTEDRLPDIPLYAVMVVFCITAGYFSGFFHNSFRTKLFLLAAGGIFSWLIL